MASKKVSKMEALATENHKITVTIPCKRFSHTDFPTQEKHGKYGIERSVLAETQDFFCPECNKQLILEPLTVENVHSNLSNEKRKYSVLKIGAVCPNCKYTDMMKMEFNVQFVVQPEKLSVEDKNPIVQH